VFDRGNNGNGSLGNVNNLDRGGASGHFLLLGNIVGRRIRRLVATVAGSRWLRGLLGLVTTVGWAIGLGRCSRHSWDVGSWGGRLGQSVGNNRRTAVVANIDRGD
jgi:hypothetical protein